MPDAHSKAVMRYQKEKTKQLCLRFFPGDMDVYDWLRERPEPASTIIKGLVREAMVDSDEQSIPTEASVGTRELTAEQEPLPKTAPGIQRGGTTMPTMQFEFLLREEKSFLESILETDLPRDAYMQAMSRLDIISRSLGEGPVEDCR